MPTCPPASDLCMICTLSKHKAEREGFHDALMLDYRGLVRQPPTSAQAAE